MSDIYTEFGVNNAVIAGGSTREEHEANMLALDVRARDGDDSITLIDPEELATDDQEVQPEEVDESGDSSSTTDDDGADALEGEFTVVPPSEELLSVNKQIGQHEEGFYQMRESAIANGLPTEIADAVMDEYASEDGISEKSYEALAKAGFNRAFVESYIAGQEALSERFVGGVIQLAGGAQRFQALTKHMETNSPASLNSLYKAMEGRDLDTITSIIELTKGSFTKKFGKAPERSLTKNTPQTPQTPNAPSKVQPFADRQEMVAAMSKPEYSKDPKYRAQVEARVAVSF